MDANTTESFLRLLRPEEKAEGEVKEIFVLNVDIFHFMALSKLEGLSHNSSSSSRFLF